MTASDLKLAPCPQAALDLAAPQIPCNAFWKGNPMTMEVETPTACGAAGVQNEIVCHDGLGSGHSTASGRWAILVWCRSSGSVERLRMVAEGQA